MISWAKKWLCMFLQTAEHAVACKLQIYFNEFCIFIIDEPLSRYSQIQYSSSGCLTRNVLFTIIIKYIPPFQNLCWDSYTHEKIDCVLHFEKKKKMKSQRVANRDDVRRNGCQHLSLVCLYCTPLVDVWRKCIWSRRMGT